jgi:hypothetical protein
MAGLTLWPTGQPSKPTMFVFPDMSNLCVTLLSPLAVEERLPQPASTSVEDLEI